MKKFKTPLAFDLIDKIVGGESRNKNDIIFDNVADLTEANEKSICFMQDLKYLDAAKKSKAGLIFVPQNFDISEISGKSLLITEQPYFKFMYLVAYWMEYDKRSKINSIHSSAIIPESCNIGNNVMLEANVVLEENVSIGDNTIVKANSVISENVSIGSNCVIYQNVTIYEDCIVGNNVILHAGAVIGSDGFGYLLHEGIQKKIPQVGNVILEDYVEVGANTTIDRATLSSTIIGTGTKLDNLVQIGHNCIIEKHSIVCAQVGLAGSTHVGNNVYLAGQVGAAGHMKIGDGTMVGAQSGVTGNVPPNSRLFGSPALEAGQQKRLVAIQKQLLTLWKPLKKVIKNYENK